MSFLFLLFNFGWWIRNHSNTSIHVTISVWWFQCTWSMIWNFGVVIGTHAWHKNDSLDSVGGCLSALDVLGSKILQEQYWNLCKETLDGISAGIRWYNIMTCIGWFPQHDILISLFWFIFGQNIPVLMLLSL